MEDFDEALSARSASVTSAFFTAVEMQLRASGDGSRKVSKISYTTATEDMYTEATPVMKTANEEVMRVSAVTEFLKNHPKLTAKGSAFGGQIDPKQARELYINVVQKWSNDTDMLSVPVTKGVTIFEGFENYPGALGDMDLQKYSSAVMKQKWLTKGSCEKLWPELFMVQKEMQDMMGDGYVLVRIHLLHFKNLSVCFNFHTDSKEHDDLTIELSVIMELSDTKSTMQIAGEASITYDSAGVLHAFDSRLWHRSGAARTDTIKIAFFFASKKTPGVKPEVKQEEKPTEDASSEVKQEEKTAEEGEKASSGGASSGGASPGGYKMLESGALVAREAYRKRMKPSIMGP